mgnify:CR=1 FL=1
MNAPIRPLRLLMSQPSIEQLGPAISALMGPRPHELLALDTAVATQRTDADVAFISREVTGTSTKHQIHPALQQVYDLLRQSPGLKWVHIHSAGADRQIYLDLKARGVHIATSSGANAQVVATVAGEGVAWTAAGALLGLALGLAVAVVLVHVVNPQSFHWTMSLSLPWERLGLLCAVVVLAGGLTTAWAARRAASVQAVRAVKEDW